MTGKTSEDGAEKQEEEDREEEETNAVDRNTQHSDSTYGTESPEALGGAHPTPEDQSRICSFSVNSQDDAQHQVTCTFSVSLAVPVIPPSQKPWMASRQEVPRTASKIRDGYIPKMHRFYHVEYILLPDDTEPRKLDLVLFGPVAKLYLETEFKVVKTWLENDQIWVSWNHSIEINVTNDFLIKLRDHKIQLRLWDTKEKVCSKARFSKAKTPALHSDPGDTESAVKRMVMYIRSFFERNEPKASYTKPSIAEESCIQQKSAISTAGAPASAARSKYQEEGSTTVNISAASCRTSSVLPSAKTEEFHSLSVISLSGSIPSSLKEKTIQEGRMIKQKHGSARPSTRQSTTVKICLGKSPSEKKGSAISAHHLQLPEKKRSPRKSFSSATEKRKGSQRSAREAAASAYARKFGVAFLQLDLMPLLSGERYLASRLAEKSPKILDAYLSFSVEKPLLNEKQKRELNPLIIRIQSARCLPSTPVPIEVLQSSCDPVYCKYIFHNFLPHQTRGRDHGTEVFFKDVNVILAGTIESGELREYLRGPPMEIEVHDRDKKMETILTKPSLFGDEPGDNRLSNVSTVTSRYMVQNPITGTEEVWHPYGIAKISLTDLLLGERDLNFYAPIHSCSVQDTSVCVGGNVTQKATGFDVTQLQLPMGHYVSSESYLKVRVELTCPLEPEDEIGEAETAYSPFGCIIYIFDYKNTSLLSNLLKEITEINAEALQLSCYSPRLIQQSLNTLKLSNKLSREEISKMDIITGFHVLDGSIHLLIVEGLKEKALKRMWNKKIDRKQETKTGRLQILYNSHLSFHERLYVDLEAVLFHIRLCKPLSSIMKQPLLYIRDMVPQACFQALTRLDYICSSTKLRDVVHRNLLPTAEMITMLSREFGVPLNKNDLLVQQYPEIAELYEHPSKYVHMRQWKPSILDDRNEEYILRKREMEKQSPQDHIQINIENVNLLSKMVKKEAPQTIRAFPSDGKSIFNYSLQTLNSAEIAQNLLRREMAQEPERRYAYSHEYLSGVYVPVDEESALKEAVEQSKEKWLSQKGFVFPGFKSSIESNMHPCKPDDARMMELMEKWQENFLNAASMKPVLDRDRWSWDKRNVDFELYKKPPQIIVVPDTSKEVPQKDMCVNTTLKVHRCSPATELISSGPKASCQLARLQGLLKDKPVKLSLKLQPTLITGGLDDVVEGSICKGFVPGIEPNHSLKWNGNKIPCHDRQHNLFQTLKGADFRLFASDHPFRYKRQPLPRLPVKAKILAVDDTQVIWEWLSTCDAGSLDRETPTFPVLTLILTRSGT